MHYCQTRLKIDTYEKDIKNIFKIPSEHERLFKIVFCSHEIRDKLYGSRRRVKVSIMVYYTKVVHTTGNNVTRIAITAEVTREIQTLRQ